MYWILSPYNLIFDGTYDYNLFDFKLVPFNF